MAHSMETIYLSLSALVAVGTFFIKYPVFRHFTIYSGNKLCHHQVFEVFSIRVRVNEEKNKGEFNIT